MSAGAATRRLELICPAGTPAALRTAVEAGADGVYCGFNNETNARNFPGLNFSRDELRDALGSAHARDVRLLVAINTFPRAGSGALWQRAVDDAARLGAAAVILAALETLASATEIPPKLRRHLSVQAPAPHAAADTHYVEMFRPHKVVPPT